MRSLWTESCSIPGFSSLPGDAETEVLIIGGGITGVLCAYFLEQRGIRYILVERNRIGSGVTEDTTAKITVQHGLIYHKLVDRFGTEAAALYYQANYNALKTYAELCADLDCDFEWKPSYVYSMNDRELLEKEAEALRKLNLADHLQDFTELPFDVAGAIRFDQQAQFHPLKFLAAIAEKRNIYEHTHVRELQKQEAITNHGTIRFQKAIFATHFPMDNKHGLYFLKLYQHRSCMIALERAPVFNGMYVDEDRKGMSFRSYKDRLLIGGGGHRTGKEGGNWKELRAFAKRYYPEAAETMAWAAQDCMSLDQIPYIGQYSKNMPGCYVATGFNKWGMTSSMAAAQLLTDLICGETSPCREIFDPSRSMFRPQLFLNAVEAGKNLLTPSRKRCPHLGCALKWNPEEHSWDCPCHGSRFDEHGKLLNNPANGDLRKDKKDKNGRGNK